MARSNLTVRVLTAAVAAPLLLAVLFWAPPWAWFALTLTACALASLELFAMTHVGDRVSQWVGVATTCGVSAALYFGSSNPRVLMALIAAVPVVALLMPLWRPGNIDSAGTRMLAGLAGPWYVGGLLTTLALLRRDATIGGPETVAMALTIAWFGDTGGYFFGKYLGRRKLYPLISPKKTVVGFFGSLLGSVLGVSLAHFTYLPALPLAAGIALGLVAGTVGQLGDLVESLLKRSTGIKDSGALLPGHGGLLDRIDALLLVGPIVFLYALATGIV